MAWIDDRVWCHPKLADLPPAVAWTWVKSVAYSAGMGTKGHLSAGQQKLIGSTPKLRAALLQAGLWDANGQPGGIVIHDWDEHNEKRDERREKDRERKRKARREGRWNESDR